MQILDINWQSFLMGEESLQFLYEVVIRTVLMFAVLLVCLRIMGRRAFMQGLFEVALIISLGSATGDAMFYSKVGLLPTLLVLVVIVLLYAVINYWISKSRYFEKIIEGHAIRIIHKGALEYEVLRKQKITIHEIFADLRTQNASHLGQIERAYLETSGKISVFFYADENVQYGMSIFPEQAERKITRIAQSGFYACARCGYTTWQEAQQDYSCDVCQNTKCIDAINSQRV